MSGRLVFSAAAGGSFFRKNLLWVDDLPNVSESDDEENPMGAGHRRDGHRRDRDRRRRRGVRAFTELSMLICVCFLSSLVFAYNRLLFC